MGKKNDYSYVDGVGLFTSRESAMIYEYFRGNNHDGVTEPIEWTLLRDALYGELGFLEHDEYVLFKIECLNPSLAEIQKRTREMIEVEELEAEAGGETRIRFARRQD